jgi:hypothetical protein
LEETVDLSQDRLSNAGAVIGSSLQKLSSFETAVEAILLQLAEFMNYLRQEYLSTVFKTQNFCD